MDLSQAIIARSDQLNADDLVAGPATFTVKEVRPTGSSEQPVAIDLVEWPQGRPFKPSKTVLRVLTYCLGVETDDWPEGVRMTLFRDEKVKWAGSEVGGIRVSHLSHIDGPKKVALAESKTKKTLQTVLPLKEVAPPPAPPADALPGLLREMTEAFNRNDISEKPARLAYCSAELGRDLTAAGDMTEDDVRQVIDALKADLTGGAA